MRRFRFLLLCSTLLAFVLGGAGAVSAHDCQPMRSFTTRIGPYPVSINYYNAPQAGEALLFDIVPTPGQTAATMYEVMAVPGTTVNAVPVRAMIEADAHAAGGVRGSVNLPVRGQWLLSIRVDGPLGPSYDDVPVLAGTPPVIPEWFGWLIGLLPVWAMIGFIVMQARRTNLSHRREPWLSV